MAQLPPLPAPGLAIFPEFLSSSTQTLQVEGDFFTADATVLLDSAPWINIEADAVSMSRRKHFIHAASNSVICDFRLETGLLSGLTYYAENKDQERLFTAYARTGLLSGVQWEVEFANIAAAKAQGGPAQVQVLKASTSAFGSETALEWNGTPVAIIESEFFSARGKRTLHVAPGMDPFVVVGLAVAIADKMRRK